MKRIAVELTASTCTLPGAMVGTGMDDASKEKKKEKKRAMKGKKRKRRIKNMLKGNAQVCEVTSRTPTSLLASILLSVLITAAQVRADAAITLCLTLTPNTRDLCGFAWDCVSYLWILGANHTLILSFQMRFFTAWQKSTQDDFSQASTCCLCSYPPVVS